MPNMDGILAASKLRKTNKELVIIMLTSKRERFKDAFKVGASRFVTKPIDKEELYEAIENALKDIDSDERLNSKKFVKVHKSYIVNMKYIKSISGRLIVLENIFLTGEWSYE